MESALTYGQICAEILFYAYSCCKVQHPHNYLFGHAGVYVAFMTLYASYTGYLAHVLRLCAFFFCRVRHFKAVFLSRCCQCPLVICYERRKAWSGKVFVRE